MTAPTRAHLDARAVEGACDVDGCGRDSTTPVCGGCAALVDRALRSIPDTPAEDTEHGRPIPGLAAELELTRIRLDRIGPDGPNVTSSPVRPLPWSERAADAATGLRDVLARWYQVLAPAPAAACPCGCDDLEVGPWCYDGHFWAWDAAQREAEWLDGDAGPGALATWLKDRRDALLGHPDAAMAASDILEAVRNAERAVDAPPALVYAGPCDYCGADLYGHIDRAVVTCIDRPGFDGCGTVYSAGARRDHLLEALREHTATAAQIAHGVALLAGVKIDRRTLNVWAVRVVDTSTDPRPKLPDRRTVEEFTAGQLKPDSGRGLERVYRVGDVLDLVAERALEGEQGRARRRDARAVLEAEQPGPAPRSRADIVADLVARDTA